MISDDYKITSVSASGDVDAGQQNMDLYDETWISANASRNYDAFERFARIQEQLAAFRKIAAVVSSDANIRDVLKIICDKTTQLMRAERTTIFLVEEDPNLGLCLNSIIAEKSGVIRLRFGQGIAGTVAKSRQYLNIDNVYQCSLFDPSFDKISGFKTRNCLAMPIMNIQRELLGVVQVINKINGDFREDADVEMLSSICSQIAVSLTQHHFYTSLINKNFELAEAREKLQQKNDELDMLYALEREAANSIDLPSMIEHMLSRCLQAFRAHYAGIFVNSGSRYVLHSVRQKTGCTRVFLDHLPEFIPANWQSEVCVRLSIREIQSLPELTEECLGFPLNGVLISPLIHDGTSMGALILGTQDLTPGTFAPSEIKLASLFAAHIAPSIGTQLNREENEKKQHLFVIGQMLSSLLHDMKTPLANISGYVELMAAQNDPQKRSSYAEVVGRHLETLKSMSSEILQFARGESAVILLKKPLHIVIAHALELVRTEAERRCIEITCRENFNGSIPYDEVKIQRVIVNLVNNAMEAIGQNGHILITTYSDELHAILRIEDDGPGIPPDIADTLFDAFVSSGKKGGTGLGLSVVQKIIDEHHASIAWEPVVPHGTAFVISFVLS